MNLLLWRHAEAEDHPNDLARALTAKGRTQASAVAAWLQAHGPADLEILVSPAVRTRQTAEALGRPYVVREQLAPGRRASELLAVAQWARAGERSVLVVGHQPTIGEAASFVLAGRELGWSVKKGGLWWIALRGEGEGREAVLRAVVSPDLA